nr:SDR family NAD(P)-dependent oxidoreductase [Brevibacterium sp. 50QC2O2]
MVEDRAGAGHQHRRLRPFRTRVSTVSARSPLPRFPELRGRVALVTGGAQGIGAAVRDTLLAQGATVISADLAHPSAEPTEVAVGTAASAAGGTAAATGGRLFEARLDVSDEAGVEALLDAAWRGVGPVSVLVNVAGMSTMDFVVDSTLANWEKTNRVNSTGTYLVARGVARRLKDAGLPGRIVLLASQAGKNGYRAMGAYVASKHAVLGLTKTMAIELAADGILVNAICPGIVETPMKHRERVEGGALRGMTAAEVEAEDNSQVPLGRTADPQDVANVALFLVSDLASYMTGQGINVTGGMTMH